MKSPSKILATLVGAATVACLAGCSGPTTATTTADSPVLPMVTASTLPPLPPPPSPTGSIGGIDVTIASTDSAPLRPGGEPMRYTVTLVNNTSADIADVGLVVTLGHCSCGYPGASMMPAGSMRMLDPDTNTWVTVPYVPEGTGTDFLNVPLVPSFFLKASQTITYPLEMRLDANPDVTAGTSHINVIIKTPGKAGTAASLPITVQP